MLRHLLVWLVFAALAGGVYFLFTPEGRHLLLGTMEGTVQVLRIETGSR